MLEQQLVVGRTYRFTFKSEFERHGVCTTSGVTCLHKGGGVFTVKQIATYGDTVMNNVNLFKNFFEPLGFSEDEFKAYFEGKPENLYTPEYTTKNVTTETTSTDIVYNSGTKSNEAVQRKEIGVRVENIETGATLIRKAYAASVCYGSYPIYKLVDVVDPDDVLWVPEQTISGFPIVDIAEYQDVTLAVDIGYWDDPNKLDGMLNSMRDRLALYGIKPLNISMISASSAWLTPDEYKDISGVRIPGTIVKIDNKNAGNYLNKQAIVSGGIKFIKENVTDTNTQIALSDLICHEGYILDPSLFIRQCDPNTDVTFEQGCIYYQTGRSSVYGDYRIRLYENEDVGGGGSAIFTAGEPIPHYTLIPSQNVEVVAGETIDSEEWTYFATGAGGTNANPSIYVPLTGSGTIRPDAHYILMEVEDSVTHENVEKFVSITEAAMTSETSYANGKLSDRTTQVYELRRANIIKMSDGIVFHSKDTTSLRRKPKNQYVDDGPEYTPIRFSLGEAGSYTIEGCYTVICNLLEAGTKVYRLSQTFSEAPAGHVVNTATYSYFTSTDGFVSSAIPADVVNGTRITAGSGIYILSNSGYVAVDKTYVDAHKSEVFLIKTKDHRWRKADTGRNGTHTFIKFEVLDFGSDTAISLVGKKFKYTNEMKSLVEVSMQAEDVLKLSCMETSTSYVHCQVGTKAIAGVRYYSSTDGVTFVPQSFSSGAELPANTYWQHQINLANTQVMRAYLNRWFEFKDSGNGGQGLTLAMRITEANFSKLLGKSGVILGTKGDLWKDTYIADDSGNNNFYRLWIESINRENVLISKNNALQTLVNSLTAENATLKDELT